MSIHYVEIGKEMFVFLLLLSFNRRTLTSAIIISHDERNFHLGRSLKLTCSFNEIDKPESVHWLKDNLLLYIDEMGTVWSASRLLASSNQDFRVTRSHWIQLNKLELNDFGVYQCTVKSNSTMSETKLELPIPTERIAAKINSTVYLNCSHRANQETPRNITWKKSSQFIVIDNKLMPSFQNGSFSDTVLSFVINKHSAGIYECYEGMQLFKKYKITLYANPTISTPKEQPTFHGWRGLLFGGGIGLLIVMILCLTYYIRENHNPALKPRKSKVTD